MISAICRQSVWGVPSAGGFSVGREFPPVGGFAAGRGFLPVGGVSVGRGLPSVGRGLPSGGASRAVGRCGTCRWPVRGFPSAGTGRAVCRYGASRLVWRGARPRTPPPQEKRPSRPVRRGRRRCFGIHTYAGSVIGASFSVSFRNIDMRERRRCGGRDGSKTAAGWRIRGQGGQSGTANGTKRKFQTASTYVSSRFDTQKWDET